MSFRKPYLFAFLLLFGRSAYGADAPVTFNNQVVRIFQQHCQTCHRPGNIAPFSLMTYADAQPWARAIQSAVVTKQMPPWKPVGSHGVFEDERFLTDPEIQTISQWVNDGSPEGAASDKPNAISFPETWSLGTPDRIVQPTEVYPVPTGSSDIYRCFPIKLNSPTDLYVRGYEILPGTRAIVHHVLLFLDQKGASEALDAADPGPGYTCFGGAGFDDGLGALGGWAPGASPQTFPLGTGVTIPAGARVVMQVHYSLVDFSRTSSGAPDPDLTRLGLYLSPTPLQSIDFLPVVNPLFLIPPGESRQKVIATMRITTDKELVAIAPHMHLLGREATVEALFPDRTSRTLIRIDDWDFHWQANYLYKEPIFLPAGTMITMTAYYDNSLNNFRNPSNPPVLVRWGERTVDEMCLTFISVKSPGIPAMNTVPFTLTDRGSESVTTRGDAAATQVGYARVADASGRAPSGLAIFGYRPNGVLISEAGVPASRLLTRGRMYAQTGGSVRSGVAIANPNSEAAVVSFVFTDESGKDVSSNSTTIPANGQIAAFLDQSIFSGPSTFSGSFTFTSSKPVAVIALRGLTNDRSDFLMTTLPVVDVSSVSGSVATVFPHFADGAGWTTTVMLVNPSETAMSGTLQFADQAGRPLSTLNLAYSIPAHSARQVSTAGSGDTVRVGTVTIVPAQGSAAPAGSLVFAFNNKSGTRQTEAGVPVAPADTAFRVYVEASDALQSGIAISNPSSSTATLRLEVTNLSGASLTSMPLTLASNAQVAKFLGELFPNLSLPVQGLLRITSSAPVAVVGLRSRTNERGEFIITTTPPVSENAPAAPELFFPHFADAGGYSTQFILFGSGSGNSISSVIRFLSQSGQPLDLKLK